MPPSPLTLGPTNIRAGSRGRYAHPPAPQPAAAATQRAGRSSRSTRRKAADDYTLVHGRRQVRLGPVAFWFVIASLVVMAGWSVLTGTYFAFHDDVLKRLIAPPGRDAIRL